MAIFAGFWADEIKQGIGILLASPGLADPRAIILGGTMARLADFAGFREDQIK